MKLRRLAMIAMITSIAHDVTGCARQPQPRSDGAASFTQVARIIDGDTLVTTAGEHVRLVQIDAPEVRSDECGNRYATEQLRRLAPPGSSIALVSDPTLDDHDRYGRLLRYVSRSRHNINVELVRFGAAAPYLYDGERGVHADQLIQTAQAARSAHRGVWGACPAAQLQPSAGWSTDPAP